MKKIAFLLFGLIAVMAMSCQTSGNGNQTQTNTVVDNQKLEESVKQAVQKMMQMDMVDDMEQMLTKDMLALQNKALGVHFEGDYFQGFQWNTGVLDACSEEIETIIEGVKVVDSLHGDVEMRYVDKGCYDEPYTMHLLKEDGQWKIDDVDYPETTLREQCKLFYEEVADWYRAASPEDIMDVFMNEEPSEESYTEPSTIYCNNPKAVKTLIGEIRNNLELFKQNPNYTEDLGQKIEAMISRIETHL